MTKPEEADVLAAGGVVCRRADAGGDEVEVAIVHRPKYDDWSLPKGKLDPGESFEEAALREVHEETGLRCRLAELLGEASYNDHRGRLKLVRYWAMTTDADEGFEPSGEVDELEWVAVPEALARLSYGFDRELVERALAKGPPPT